MSEQPMTPEPCEHHWISYGQPSHSPLRWILKCSQCNQFNIEKLQEEAQRIRAEALREAREAWFEHAEHMNGTPSKYYPSLWLKNRADRLEGDDETH